MSESPPSTRREALNRPDTGPHLRHRGGAPPGALFDAAGGRGAREREVPRRRPGPMGAGAAGAPAHRARAPPVTRGPAPPPAPGPAVAGEGALSFSQGAIKAFEGPTNANAPPPTEKKGGAKGPSHDPLYQPKLTTRPCGGRAPPEGASHSPAVYW